MSTVDDKVDRLADRLQAFARRSAADGGVKAKLAQPLAEDADFVRKLKPSLIRARAKGEAPTTGQPSTTPLAPSAPQLGRRRRTSGGGPNPWVVAGVCLVTGIAIAKWIDRRGHAHSRG